MKFLRWCLICWSGVLLLMAGVLIGSRHAPADFPFLVYTRAVLNGSHIYIVWGDGSHVRRISNTNQFNHSPLWSADGQHIAYQSFSPDGNVWITVQRLYDKHPSTHLPDLPGKEILKSWSPGEPALLMMVTEPQIERQVDLMILTLKGSSQFLGQFQIDRTPAAAWSSDGRWIYFEAPFGSNKALYRVRINGTDLTPIIPDVNFVYALRWSPNGEWLIFMAEIGEANGIYRMHPDGSQLALIHATGNARIEENWVLWSPDGSYIVYMTADGSLYALRPDGSDIRDLTGEAADLIGWQGQWLYFLSINDAVSRIRIEDGQREQLFYLRGATQMSWSPPIDLPFRGGWLIIAGLFALSIGTSSPRKWL